MKSSKYPKWKIYMGSAESYENYFILLLEPNNTGINTNKDHKFKLNKTFQNYSDDEFRDLLNWTLAQSICYHIINKQFLERQNLLRKFLIETVKKYQKLSKGLSISMDLKKLNKEIVELDFNFCSSISDVQFLNVDSFDLKKVNNLFVENFVLSKAFRKQRAELKKIYVSSLFLTRESYRCRYGKQGDKKFKEFVSNEIFPNKELSNFLKHAKSKENNDLKIAALEDVEVIKSEQSFDLFYKALNKTIQRFKK